MWANAQRDGRPAEYRWRPPFNAALWLTPTTRVSCSNAAKTRKPLKLHGVPQTNETISAASGPKFTILWGHVEDILLLNKFFMTVDTCSSSSSRVYSTLWSYCADVWRRYCCLTNFFRLLICAIIAKISVA